MRTISGIKVKLQNSDKLDSLSRMYWLGRLHELELIQHYNLETFKNMKNDTLHELELILSEYLKIA